MRYAVALVLTFCVIGGCSARRDCGSAYVSFILEDSIWTQDFPAAVAPCTKAAEQGDAYSQYWLGLIYAEDAAPSSAAKAIEWFTKVAKQGEDLGLQVLAQYELGKMYYNGQGIRKDYGRAFDWWAKAAEQGAAGPQSYIGWMYHNGLGVPMDDAKAAEWLTKAAEQGIVEAQALLGAMYGKGEGVLENNKMAYFWLNLADTLTEDPKHREAVVVLRDAAAQEMTPQEIEEAQRMSAEWLEKFKARQDED